MSSKQYWIYHERQEALLCGQHALNNLVQQNAFSPGSLAEIAMQLDAMELNYMAQNNEGGVRSKDYLNRAAEGSGNVVCATFPCVKFYPRVLLYQFTGACNIE